MGIFQSQPTNGAEIVEVKKKGIKKAFKDSEDALELLMRYYNNAILPQTFAKNFKSELVARTIEKAREDITEIAGHLGRLLADLKAFKKTLVKGYPQVMDAEALISEAAKILRTQWDKVLQNILFELRNNRYTGGLKSEKLKKAEESKKSIPWILSLFMKEEGAHSINELRRKLEESRNDIILALELVVKASNYF